MVVQAVLLTVLVATISLVAIINRVAASRQGAAAGSLAAAARQAAEVGYSEIMAEMNRDPKSYLWVTKFDQWTQVSNVDMNSCGVGSTAPPSPNPIPGLGTPVDISTTFNTAAGVTINLPINLSYQLTDYRVPESLTITPSQPDCSKFGNLFGGTALITIVGTAKRTAGGEVTTFTLKRTISVKRAAALFNNPLFVTPLNRTGLAGVTASDNRFPAYPAPPGLPAFDVTCQQNVPPAAEAGTYEIQCTAPGVTAASFRSATPPSTSTTKPFPYQGQADGSTSIWPVCSLIGSAIKCSINSLTVGAPGSPIVMPVDTSTNQNQVEFYLKGALTIESGSLLTGLPPNKANESNTNIDYWKRFLIYADDSSGCGAQIKINGYVNPFKSTPASGDWDEPNLQSAFVWLRCGSISNLATVAFDAAPALIGWAPTITSTVAVAPTTTTVAPRFVYEGLGGPYGFNGIFGASNPIRFQYRGFGFYEQSPNLP
jgi:hypothetical protein